MLNIRIERSGEMATLHCAGRIMAGSSLAALRQAVLCQLDRRSIALDLSGVDRIDAAGLGELVFLHTCTNGLGTELRLVGPSARVAEVLELTNLSSVFTIAPAAEPAAGLAVFSPRQFCPACA